MTASAIGPEPGGKIVDLPMASEVARYQGEPVAAVIAVGLGCGLASRAQAANPQEEPAAGAAEEATEEGSERHADS